jgi:2-polyprenyl-6-hydroxyphenyl methylase/3-demethylubiquinone-9 3-methyltransferase
VDFSKNCREHEGNFFLALRGIPIYYYRCPQCGFIFTTAFDHFSADDFKRSVYNDDYLAVDPDYREARPRGCAAFLGQLFPTIKPSMILDYGGGSGLLSQYLRGSGFPRADTYDPFVPEHAARPHERYPCIVSFEVFEHSTDPAKTIGEMNALLADPGVIVFSTLLQPADITTQGLNWWYAGPRNGHVSLHSRNSLLALLKPFGLQLGSFNDGTHVLFRHIPDFARQWFRQ